MSTKKTTRKGFSSSPLITGLLRCGLFLVAIFSFFSPLASAADGLETGAVLPSKLLIIGALTLFFILLGLFADIPYFTLVGAALLFLIGFLINGGYIYLPTGLTTELYIYGDNYDGYHYDDYNGTTKVDNLNVFHLNETKHYAAWTGTNSHLIGWLIMFISFVFFALSLFSLRGGDDY